MKVTRHFKTDQDPGSFTPDGAVGTGAAFGGGIVATSVTDGTHTVIPTSQLDFSGATVTDLTGGVAQISGFSGPPTGAAGGDLGGTYPNPTVAKINTSPLGTTTGASTNDVLTWNGSAWTHQAPSGSSPLTTKGDLFGHSTVDARIPIGTDTYVLTADSSQTLGLKWAAAGGGGGGSGYQLDAYTIDGTYGDDFKTASLAGIWTRRNFTGGAETYQLGQAATWMRVSLSGRSAGDGYLQTAPGGDWTFAMAVVQRTGHRGNPYFGVACVNSSGTGVIAAFYISPIALLVEQLTTYSSYGGTFSQTTARQSPEPWGGEDKCWLYLRKSGTSYFAAYSVDGDLWSDETASFTSGITVDRVGFLMQPLGTGTTILDIDWFNKIA